MKHYLVILLFLFSGIASGQNRPSFEHITIEDGLANNSVRSIFQDREGYLWFGTLNGLSRYDGQQFKTFIFDPDDSTSISNNKIREIFQDGAGYLWITTYNEHAHRFDPRTETFINFPEALDQAYAGCSVHTVYESSPGVVWLYLVGKGCARVISVPDSPEYSIAWFNTGNILPSDNINFFRAGVNGGIWIGTSEGICYFPDDRLSGKEQSKVRTFFSDPGLSVVAVLETEKSVWIGCQSGEVFKLDGDKPELFWKTPEWGGTNNTISFIEPTRKNGQLLVGSRKGLLLINETTEERVHLTPRNSNVITSYIISFFHDSHDDLWLVTSRRGVTRFQPRTNEFTYFPLQPEIRQSILEGEKQVFWEDHNRDLWVGIYGGGISRFNRQTGQFDQFLHKEDNPGSLSSNLILSVFEDRSGNLWAGTYKRGLNKINLRQNNFYFPVNKAGINRDFNNEVRAVFEDSRKWIWTGNKKGELIVYDQHMEQLFTGDEIPGLGRETIATGIYAFEEDRHHNLWIGTKGNGIFILKDLPSSAALITSARIRTEHLFSDPANPAGLSHNDVFDLHEDRFGQMWVALYHGGLNVIRDPLQEDWQILQYRENEHDRFSISDDRVRCILEDDKGNMWIGTANGLNFLSSQYQSTANKKFQIIERSFDPGSLSHNDIISIVQDSDENIWVCTYGGGLNKLRTGDTEQPFVFDQVTEKGGLSSDLILGLVEDDRKNLWIDTDFGLCKYDPAKDSFENFYEADGLAENSFSEGRGTKTSSGLLVFGDLSGMIWFDPDSIQKSGKQVPVVLTNLLIGGQPDREKFNVARQMLGDSLHSIKLRYDENFLTFEFAALDFKAPAKIRYKFMLEHYEENWNRSGNLNRAIYRDLQPGQYVFRLKASNSDGLWVNPELKLSLTIAPPPWQTFWAYMAYLLLATGLFFLIRRIVLERIRLKHEVEFEKKLSDDKLRFYTSISHEFKTPLALILGPVEDLLGGNNLPPAILNPLQMVRRNTWRLLELIEQLMDFRKIQKGFLKVDPTSGDLVCFLDEIYNTFVPLAEKQQLIFNFDHDLPEFVTSLDYRSLEKIVFNLLSNAFKHTAAGQRVELKLIVDEKTGWLTIMVTDEGEGIREQDLPHIFERFSLGNHSRWKDESSTGVGLSLAKELVELLHGSISVESAPGKGSCFMVKLPLLPAEVSGTVADQPATVNDYTRKFIQVVDEEPLMAEEKEKKTMLTRETVLIVEDHPDLRTYLVGNLSGMYRVLQAGNGKEGLEVAKNENPDLIVCDIMMPEMDGLELTGILKNEFHTSHIPVILLTVRSQEDQKIEGIETGADDYITKPFNMRYLQKRIGNILKQRKQLKERYSRDLQSVPGDLVQSGADREFLEEVIRLVEENMADPEFSVDSLLQHFSFGRTVFYKKMKGITGYPPKDFIRIIRMKKAGALLLKHHLNVTEVSFAVGFNDPDYFSRLFKKHFGESPSAYQKVNVLIKQAQRPNGV